MQTQENNKGANSTARRSPHTMAAFIEQSGLDEALVKAVVRQRGIGWKEFRESANDMRQADAGFSGFTYYSDTVDFAQKNKRAIEKQLKTDADDFGTAGGFLGLIASFNCLQLEISEVAEAYYGDDSKDYHTNVHNALAWYALETVAGRVSDWLGE